MGQRTISVIEIHQEEKTEIRRVAYHKQWGHGTETASALLGMLQCQFFTPNCGEFQEGIEAETYKKRLTEPEKTHPSMSLYFSEEDLHEYLLDSGKIDMKRVIHNHDNNNGGVYLTIYMDKYGIIREGTLDFYLGYEDIEEGEQEGDKVSMQNYFDRFSDAYSTIPYRELFKENGIEAK